MKKHKKLRKIILIVLLVFVVVFFGCFLVLNIYSKTGTYKAVDVDTYLESTDEAKVTTKNKNIYFEPENKNNIGFIFYPGGLVDKKAYSPIASSLALKGYYTVIVNMPYNLAIFGSNNAKGIIKDETDIKQWYIGGHSLGGAFAAKYYKDNMSSVSGLVLMASYSIYDIKDGNVLSIYGSNDKVLSMEKYEKNIVNLPSNFNEIVIDGGIHSYFGSYGHQKGDGEATISREQQTTIVVDAIDEFLGGNNAN